MADIQELIGKEVEVMANGVSYRGTLVEVSDAEVHLRTALQWVALPASSVAQITIREQAKRQAAADTIELPEEIGDWQTIDESEPAEST